MKKEVKQIKKILSVTLNLLIFAFSVVGILLACILARRDGYSHWYKRLYYFTQLSNIWIGVTSLVFAIMTVRNKPLKTVGLFKYVFTVSITVTGIIFCVLLAPFADFNIWTFSSVLTHIVVPVLSVFDYFTNEDIVVEKPGRAFLTLIPPAIYFVFAGTLSLLGVDFGRGDTFPYFFMDFKSEVGLFGYNFEGLPQLGTAYWIVFFLFFIYGLGLLYYKFKKLLEKANKC